MSQEEETPSGAKFSADRLYRYRLWRVWSSDPRRIFFVCLNPSKANEIQSDRTLETCIRWAKIRAGGCIIGNLFAFVSTDREKLKQVADPKGPENDFYLKKMHGESTKTITAWGEWGKLHGRGDAVMKMLEQIKPTFRFGVNLDGTPKHPLYFLKPEMEPSPNVPES